MEKSIIDIIDEKAVRQYKNMTAIKKTAYRAMLYAGAQVMENGYTVRAVAVEIGYSETGTSKLVQKWKELKKDGDITVNRIIAAIQRLPKSKRMGRVQNDTSSNVATDSPKDKEEVKKNKVVCTHQPKLNTLHGFNISHDDEVQRRVAIRSSIVFFQSYGKGMPPRLDGEYFTPGTNPFTKNADEGKWLPLDTAAFYCGCKEDVIISAGQAGTIERRIYCRNANHTHYEYKLEDLDRFIRDNHLL